MGRPTGPVGSGLLRSRESRPGGGWSTAAPPAGGAAAWLTGRGDYSLMDYTAIHSAP